MKNYSYRFESIVDEVAHIILSLYEFDIYEQQINELTLVYGKETVEEATTIVKCIIDKIK